MVGYALDCHREAFCGSHPDRMIIVIFEALTRDPDVTLKIIYDLIDGEPFDHDFNNVMYSAADFDESLGSLGLYAVCRKAAFIDRCRVLPLELFARYQNDCFWTDDGLNMRGVPIIRFGE